MKKVLVLNISTDSNNTSLGFAISWLNAFAKKFDEVHVITLNKGSEDELEENVVKLKLIPFMVVGSIPVVFITWILSYFSFLIIFKSYRKKVKK